MQSKEKIIEKKRFWRQYREREEELDLDEEEKLEIIGETKTLIAVSRFSSQTNICILFII